MGIICKQSKIQEIQAKQDFTFTSRAEIEKKKEKKKQENEDNQNSMEEEDDGIDEDAEPIFQQKLQNEILIKAKIAQSSADSILTNHDVPLIVPRQIYNGLLQKRYSFILKSQKKNKINSDDDDDDFHAGEEDENDSESEDSDEPESVSKIKSDNPFIGSYSLYSNTYSSLLKNNPQFYILLFFFLFRKSFCLLFDGRQVLPFSSSNKF
ncbi:unnamed protein product [Paramecium octaurelia]|uniref:Uncharacterized protein n=1 Tax=Paramecium octaurelia TaxID=43137 RepID=A0A8S1VCW1_PAROT|nr:unnamed protein product [Paramecium octaurelia]